MSQKANINIYLQAVGGHFLGAHACDPANITVTLTYSGGTVDIPYPITENFTDDGNPSPFFISGASTYMPIITIASSPAQPASVNFLSADFTTVAARTMIDMPTEIELADILVSVPTSLGKPIMIKQQMILNPAQPGYQVVIPVAGLYLSPASVTGSIAVFVKMMCGCPVTQGPPASLWPEADFTVYANVLDKAGNSASYLLSYTPGQTGNSQFSTVLPAGHPGISAITYSAFQKSTGNYGVLAGTP